jgi:hypothetical protein
MTYGPTDQPLESERYHPNHGSVFFEAGRAAESCSVFAPFPGHGPALVWRV